jgi:hypothetical protein
MSRTAQIWVLGALVALGGRALAGPQYQYVFNQPNYTVAPGGAVAVTVSILETLNPQTDASLLAPGTDGLIGGGLLVQVAAPLPTSPAKVTSPSAIQGNSAFGVIQLPQLPAPGVANSAGLLELASNPVFGTITSLTATSETVLLPLGTFTFTAGNLPGEVSDLEAMNTTIDGVTTSANNVTASGIVLDPLLQTGSATITVLGAAVPEPSGAALVFIGLVGAAIARGWKHSAREYSHGMRIVSRQTSTKRG